MYYNLVMCNILIASINEDEDIYQIKNLENDDVFNKLIENVEHTISNYNKSKEDILKLQMFSICVSAQVDKEYVKKKIGSIINKIKKNSSLKWIIDLQEEVQTLDYYKPRKFAKNYLKTLAKIAFGNKNNIDFMIISAKNFINHINQPYKQQFAMDEEKKQILTLFKTINDESLEKNFEEIFE